jgi:hypothetical protein
VTSSVHSERPQSQGGPPLGVLAIVFAAHFLAGIVISTAMAGGDTFPAPFGPAADILAYFRDHQDAVRVNAFLQFAAAIPLAIYAATVAARLNRLGIRAPGATIALVGGVLSAAFLACSALLTWVLSRPEILGEPALVRALQDLAFAAGGPGHVAPLGLLVAGIAVPSLLARLLPRWLAVAGLVIAVLAELGILTLLLTDAAFLLPLARFTSLAWLIAVGFLLPRNRTNKTATNRITATPQALAEHS